MTQFGLRGAFRTVVKVLADLARVGFLTLHSRTRLGRGELVLRKQLALYLEQQVKPRRADDATFIVKPDTLIRWHRKAFRLFWRWKAKKRGRPRT